MKPTNGSDHEIMARIAGLLTHYWAASEPAAVRQQQLRDWHEDLEEFSPELVGEACKAYRRGADRARRPLPGDIRQLCLDRRADERELRMISDARREASSSWPAWLADLWGPAPEGPRKRAEAIARDKARLRNYLDLKPAEVKAAEKAREFNPSPEQMKAARQELGIDGV